MWQGIIHAIKRRVSQLRPEGGAPWLKIITYVEGIQASTVDHLIAESTAEEVSRDSPDDDGDDPESPLHSPCPRSLDTMVHIGRIESGPSFRTHSLQSKLVFDVAGTRLSESVDPRSANCATGIKELYQELCAATTRWAWDGESFDALYPDKPYDAKTSALIEKAYRSGAPSVWVTAKHKIIFRDMVQRVVEDPMRLRLVFRYPEPCFDCDAQVRKFPSMLREISGGNCLVFIGAGFCIPAGAPSWGNLLIDIAQKSLQCAKDDLRQPQARDLCVEELEEIVEDRKAVRNEVHRLVSAGGNHTSYELAAQLLEDSLKGSMQEYLADILKNQVPKGQEILQKRTELDVPPLDLRRRSVFPDRSRSTSLLDDAPQEYHTSFHIDALASRKSKPSQPKATPDYNVMASRIDYIQCMKFFAVLTTNYSWELCICQKPYEKGKADTGCGICKGITPLSGADRLPQFLDIVRTMPSQFVPMHRRQIVQIHGSVSEPGTIVLSREGYRKLLHGNRNYHDFLKSVMMSRTILYVGFSFTDDYLNEVRSEIMSMKGTTSRTKNLAYAIIADKSPSHCAYYDQHEGVKILTWDSSLYGHGVMDRYMDSILCMTDTSAALSGAKLILFLPPREGTERSSGKEKLLKIQLELANETRKSFVQNVMHRDCYLPYQVVVAETLAEVEAALKKQDFLQSYVVTFADEGWKSIPLTHLELLQFLWHPHARLATELYPPTLLVWGSRSNFNKDTPGGLSLKERYERHLHVKFCANLDDVFAAFCFRGLPETSAEVAVREDA